VFVKQSYDEMTGLLMRESLLIKNSYDISSQVAFNKNKSQSHEFYKQDE